MILQGKSFQQSAVSSQRSAVSGQRSAGQRVSGSAVSYQQSAISGQRSAPSHGYTMGYVSGPFRTEGQNPTLKGSLHQPMVEPWDGAITLEKQSWRVFEIRLLKAES